ncbi:antiterminator LoaP [Caldalkalibacillus mannanilyticus]|uniref:antiterminator LoaP n=1 Tax=Caldalkalibacillus mannanilyticus TaxID=1418 RepID=UPI001F298B69|nr:antiterminator LoaP [Caldalkalibacillus mannanilyticus]
MNKFIDQSVIRVMVPKRKIRERREGKLCEVSKIMLPGYVLLNTYMNIDLYYKLKEIPRCFRLLNINKYNVDYDLKDVENQERQVTCFTPIEEKEMALILRLAQYDEEIGFSQVHKENSKVFVRSGPLKGLEGIIKKIDKRKNRAKISLDFMGETQLVDVGIEILDSHK